jgi:O6-methylguanine-DNA--protein-cysteine methyltransferase
VINADGSMGGYGGGGARKHKLLELEKLYAHRFRETAA